MHLVHTMSLVKLLTGYLAIGKKKVNKTNHFAVNLFWHPHSLRIISDDTRITHKEKNCKLPEAMRNCNPQLEVMMSGSLCKGIPPCVPSKSLDAAY